MSFRPESCVFIVYRPFSCFSFSLASRLSSLAFSVARAFKTAAWARKSELEPSPPTAAKKFDDEREEIWRHIERYTLLSSASVFVLGDTNSRVGNRDDRGIVFLGDGVCF